nr:MAG TPA: hypothetical protein [Caudoviricetes sp.]DAX76366.1 MAG TPA: hypothetical protein [Caudoviricetes sp.]
MKANQNQLALELTILSILLMLTVLALLDTLV